MSAERSRQCPAAAKPHQLYAADWALGRVAIALADATGERDGPADTIKDRAGVEQLFCRAAGPLPPLRRPHPAPVPSALTTAGN